MSVRKVLVLAVVFLLVGTVSFGQKRTERISVVVTESENVVGQCEGFEIWDDAVALLSWTDLYNKNGQWVKTNQHYRILGETLYYNSEDPSRSVLGGPGEVEHEQFFAATGVLKADGLSWKIKVPGYGLIWAETGAMVWQCDPYTFANCVLVSNTGHNQFVDEDLAALCNYLK
jgi:hypothetical protein